MQDGTLKIEKVTDIATKQAQPACRFSITASLDGFPVEIQGEGRACDLKAIVDRLKAMGATTPQATKPEPTKAAGTPLCPVHNAPMKASRKPGSYFCPRRGDDGDFCAHKT